MQAQIPTDPRVAEFGPEAANGSVLADWARKQYLSKLVYDAASQKYDLVNGDLSVEMLRQERLQRLAAASHALAQSDGRDVGKTTNVQQSEGFPSLQPLSLEALGTLSQKSLERAKSLADARAAESARLKASRKVLERQMTELSKAMGSLREDSGSLCGNSHGPSATDILTASSRTHAETATDNTLAEFHPTHAGISPLPDALARIVADAQAAVMKSPGRLEWLKKENERYRKLVGEAESSVSLAHSPGGRQPAPSQTEPAIFLTPSTAEPQPLQAPRSVSNLRQSPFDRVGHPPNDFMRGPAVVPYDSSSTARFATGMTPLSNVPATNLPPTNFGIAPVGEGSGENPESPDAADNQPSPLSAAPPRTPTPPDPKAKAKRAPRRRRLLGIF